MTCEEDGLSDEEQNWHDTGEEIAIRYVPTTVEDGVRILVAAGPVPDGIPVEIHLDEHTQIRAIYADGFVDEDPVPLPSNPGETLSDEGA